MKLEVKNGTITWTVESTGNISEKDFVSVISNASISTVKFIEIYYDYYSECKDHKTAYERVETLHENLLGRRKFPDYDCFRRMKSYNMNKK